MGAPTKEKVAFVGRLLALMIGVLFGLVLLVIPTLVGIYGYKGEKGARGFAPHGVAGGVIGFIIGIILVIVYLFFLDDQVLD